MMYIQAEDTAVSIRISAEPVPQGAALRQLVCRALAERGLEPWPAMEAECFTAGQDALIIARPVRDSRPAFYFDELETLLAGALNCAGGQSALYTAGPGYLLAVDRAGAGPGLYEYGAAGRVSSAWERHAAEQGACLIPAEAIDTLRRYFGGQV